MDRRLQKWLGILVLGLLGTARLSAAETDLQVESVLQNWESISQDRGRDGLTVRTLQSFLGPVREANLRERFAWSFCSPCELQAVPTEPAERQFLPDVRVVIDSSGLPKSVTIGQLKHEVLDLVRQEIKQVAARELISQDSGIVRVSFNPEGEASNSPAVNPRVSEVLSRWVAGSMAANAVRTTFRRTDYDSATEVESHATGTLIYNAPYYGLYQSHSVSKTAAQSTRVGLDGQPYVQLPGQETMLLWTGGNLTHVDVPSQRYEVHQLPGSVRQYLCGGSFDAVWQTLIAPQTALPMVVGLQEKELRSNYDWKLVTDNQTAIILHGTPVSGADAMLYQSAQVVIDPATFRTRATRMLDISGTKETVHEFTDQVVSKDGAALGQWQPDLSEFECLGEVPGVEPASFVEDGQSAAPLLPAAE